MLLYRRLNCHGPQLEHDTSASQTKTEGTAWTVEALILIVVAGDNLQQSLLNLGATAYRCQEQFRDFTPISTNDSMMAVNHAIPRVLIDCNTPSSVRVPYARETTLIVGEHMIL